MYVSGDKVKTLAHNEETNIAVGDHGRMAHKTVQKEPNLLSKEDVECELGFKFKAKNFLLRYKKPKNLPGCIWFPVLPFHF